MRENRSKSPVVERTCAQCNVSFRFVEYPSRVGRTAFCSRACRDISRRKRLERICEACGVTFEVYTARLTQTPARYCSRKCYFSCQARPLADRFWEKVDKNGPVPPHCPERGPCWIWTGARYSNDYGAFTLREGGKLTTTAQRIALFLSTGEMPTSDIEGCHHCDNPPCVRPSHLFWGTQLENMADAKSKGRPIGRPSPT
jgi:hypothetical protein